MVRRPATGFVQPWVYHNSLNDANRETDRLTPRRAAPDWDGEIKPAFFHPHIRAQNDHKL